MFSYFVLDFKSLWNNFGDVVDRKQSFLDYKNVHVT